MNKLDAILELIRESHSERRTATSAKRIKRACDVLDFDDTERTTIFQQLEYHNGEKWFGPSPNDFARIADVRLPFVPSAPTSRAEH